MGLQESDAAEHMKLNCTCFDEWYGHNKNWDFMLEFLVFLTSHMQSNSRVYQFLFHTLLNKTLCDPPLATFPTAAQILPCPPPHLYFTILQLFWLPMFLKLVQQPLDSELLHLLFHLPGTLSPNIHMNFFLISFPCSNVTAVSFLFFLFWIIFMVLEIWIFHPLRK